MTECCVVCGKPLRGWQRTNWTLEDGKFHMKCFDTLIDEKREELKEDIENAKLVRAKLVRG